MIGLNVYSFIMPGVKLISSICISGILGALIGWLGIFTNRSLGYIDYAFFLQHLPRH